MRLFKTQTDSLILILENHVRINVMDQQEAEVYLRTAYIDYSILRSMGGGYKITVNRYLPRWGSVHLDMDELTYTYSGKILHFRTLWGARRRVKREMKRQRDGIKRIIQSTPNFVRDVVETTTFKN